MKNKIYTQPIESGQPAPSATVIGGCSSRGASMPRSTRLPKWLKISAGFNEEYLRVKRVMTDNRLHTVCGEAACPNIRECWGEGTATFMILGKFCTRGCRFCDVLTGRPHGLDTDEPRRLAEGVAALGLKQVVITSVTRDDLPDGGAQIFAETLRELRMRDPLVKVEFLIPDMQGKMEDVRTILESQPDVFAHNVETVERLYRRVRPGAELARSLAVLEEGHNFNPRPVVKTGIMVGLGETLSEITELFYQLRDVGTDIVTVGQYLRPSDDHLPVERFYPPEEFTEIAEIGKKIGFGHVEAGPLVRSSYRAFNQSKRLLSNAS